MTDTAFPDIDPSASTRWLMVPGDWRRPGNAERFEILWEAPRAYGQIWPRPGPAEVAAYYDVDDYYTHGAGAAPEPPPGLAQRLMTRIAWKGDTGSEADRQWWARLLGDQARDILDIGCGSGKNLSTLAALGHRAVGVEPDPDARAVARAAGHEVHAGTAETLPPELTARRFDLVVFMHVLEHCIAPLAAMHNATGLLRDGGMIVAEVPNNACLGATRFGILWHWLDVPRHLNFFTAPSLGALFGAAGLEIAETAHCGYVRQFSADWKATQTEIARRLGVPGHAIPTERAYWRYLAATLRSEPSKKYDSVRMVGRLRTARDEDR